jgi:hypothetical protein
MTMAATDAGSGLTEASMVLGKASNKFQKCKTPPTPTWRQAAVLWVLRYIALLQRAVNQSTHLAEYTVFCASLSMAHDTTLADHEAGGRKSQIV